MTPCMRNCFQCRLYIPVVTVDAGDLLSWVFFTRCSGYLVGCLFENASNILPNVNIKGLHIEYSSLTWAFAVFAFKVAVSSGT